MKKGIIALFVFALTASGLIAQAQTPVINKTQKDQHARIVQGVKSGELTKAEAKKLTAEQKDIRTDKQIAKADGKATPTEKKIIKREQKKVSKDIHRLKHNKRTALPK